MHKAQFALKNSVVYYLLKNRKDRKVKNLKKILEEFIAKKNKQKELQRIKKREMEGLELEEKLQKLVDEDKVLSDIQYENVKEIMDTIIKENIEANFTQLRLLQDNLVKRLLKKGNGKSNLGDYKNVKLTEWLSFQLPIYFVLFLNFPTYKNYFK